jgi:hypothetical protein
MLGTTTGMGVGVGGGVGVGTDVAVGNGVGVGGDPIHDTIRRADMAIVQSQQQAGPWQAVGHRLHASVVQDNVVYQACLAYPNSQGYQGISLYQIQLVQCFGVGNANVVQLGRRLALN